MVQVVHVIICYSLLFARNYDVLINNMPTITRTWVWRQISLCAFLMCYGQCLNVAMWYLCCLCLIVQHVESILWTTHAVWSNASSIVHQCPIGIIIIINLHLGAGFEIRANSLGGRLKIKVPKNERVYINQLSPFISIKCHWEKKNEPCQMRSIGQTPQLLKIIGKIIKENLSAIEKNMAECHSRPNYGPRCAALCVSLVHFRYINRNAIIGILKSKDTNTLFAVACRGIVMPGTNSYCMHPPPEKWQLTFYSNEV